MNSSANFSTLFCANGTDVGACALDPGNSTQMRQGLLDAKFISAYNIYLYITISLGVPGNLIVLTVFLKNPPSTSTDWFIVFITLYDFLTALISSPIYVTFTNGAWQIYGSSIICKLHFFTSQTIVLSSSFLICGLALDRYFKICRPNSKAFTKQRAKYYCIIITFANMLLAIPIFTMYENVNGRCNVLASEKDVFAYYMMVLVSFLIATVTFIISYINVTRAIIQSEKNVRRHKTTAMTSPQRTCRSWLFCCKAGYRTRRVVPIFTSSVSGTCPSQENGIRVSKSTQAESVQTRNTNGTLRLPPISANKWTSDMHVSEISSSSSQYLQGSQPSKPLNKPGIVVKRKSDRAEDKRTVSLRTTKIAFLVCTIFVVTWIPPWVSFLIATSPRLLTKKEILEFLIFGKMTHLLNTVVNPVLYTGLNRRFRNQAKAILCCKKS